MEVLHILIWTLFVLIFLIFALLFIPVKYNISSFLKEGEIKYNIKISLFTFSFQFTKSSALNIDFNKFENSIENLEDNLSKKSSVSDLVFVIKKLVDKLTPRQLKIEGEYGFLDPSYTGMITGIIYTVLPFLKRAEVSLKPDFLSSELYIRLEIYGKIIPGFLLKTALEMYFALIKKKMKVKSIQGGIL
ncbi:DUF2953 domain-containing protein [Clostridium sp. cel8]|uniref:DUF2953 domain-containing protein n=1 Tax=Clostridium sp. cel8 TaxID=2663123 RepID=UPI0015F72AB5|nr:DUF2953 domain-containing protein [Clostridium sp. cel8]MBA5850051.1 DUF2953 domain-containing protein [Clostridium sp. cel8]